ncbi:MAG: Uma2 family endonuclease [Chloroflexota bacterium]
MSKTVSLPSKVGEPTWEIAELLYPYQGSWTVQKYLALDTNKLIEFTQGKLELLPMPSQSHQLFVYYLFKLLQTYIAKHQIGTALFAPFRIRLDEGRFREPDIMFCFFKNDSRRHEQYWEGADLVMEVVSPDDPKRDTVEKREEYAQAGIPEYWIVNPLDKTITVLTLNDKIYDVYRVCGERETAQSKLLPGFEANVTAVFASAK